jgi:CBS domain-containing protein
VTCCEDADISEAVARMAERKVRRIPVVDRGGALQGIIAQADIATRVQRDKTTGELVEAISEPGTVRKS